MKKLILMALVLMLCASALAEARWPFDLTDDTTLEEAIAVAVDVFGEGFYEDDNAYIINRTSVPMMDKTVSYVRVRAGTRPGSFIMQISCCEDRGVADHYIAGTAAYDVALEYGIPDKSEFESDAADPFGRNASSFENDIDDLMAMMQKTPYVDCRYKGTWLMDNGGFIFELHPMEHLIFYYYTWIWLPEL